MLQRITLGRSHCGFCGEWGLVAVLDATEAEPPVEVEACERCLRATVKAADLLKVVRQAKAVPPKKGRKGSQSRKAAPRLHPPKEAVSSLVPPVEDAP